MLITYWLDLALIITGFFWCFMVGLMFIGLMRCVAVDKRIKSRNTLQIDYLPSVSVLVAARNEEANIKNCLESLIGQDYPVDKLQIYIVDDRSEDSTAQIVQQYSEKYPIVHLLTASEPPPGIAPKKNAIMHGIESSSGDLILTTDADCTPSKKWVSTMISRFVGGVDAVVGFSPLTGTGLAAAISRFDSFVNAVVSASTIGLNKPTTAVGRNFAYRRSAWEQVSGFGSSVSGASGDDDLLLQRIAYGNHMPDSKVCYTPKVIFSIDPDSNVIALGPDNLSAWLKMKRRHISAGSRYKAKMIFISIFLYLFNILLILWGLMEVSGFYTGNFAPYIWETKLIFDALTLSLGAIILKHRGWAVQWMIAELVSPVLFTLLIPASLFGKIGWKGRILNR